VYITNLFLQRFCSLSFGHVTGHSQSVTDASWTNDGLSLLTSSEDKTAVVWSSLKPDHPVMKFTNISTNLAASASTGTKSTSGQSVVKSKPNVRSLSIHLDLIIHLYTNNLQHINTFNNNNNTQK